MAPRLVSPRATAGVAGLARPPTTGRAAPLPDTAAPRPGARRVGRIAGIDLARTLAILGMFAVNLGPTAAESLPEHLYALPHGRASLLFALVAGVGVSLLAASPTATGRDTRATLLWRAGLLLPLGLALQELDLAVTVVLQTYAVLFIVATLLISLPDRWLLRLVAVTAVAGPLLHLAGERAAPELFARDPIALTDPVARIGHGLLLSGPYPLVTWLAPFALGLWLGRRDLRSSTVHRRLLGVGATVAVLTAALSRALIAVTGTSGTDWWEPLLVDAAHSQRPLWLIGATAAAVTVLGASLWIVPRAPRLTAPLVRAGQLALTLYVAHLVAFHLGGDRVTADAVGPAVGLLAAFAATGIGLAVAWRAAFPRGPLEVLLQRPRGRRARPTPSRDG